MGANKRAWGIMKAGGKLTGAWRALKSGSDNLMQAERDVHDRAEALKKPGALMSICLELPYTGTAPTIDGRYLVVNMLTGTIRVALVGHMIGEVRCVTFLETSTTMKLAEAVTPHQRWFMVPKPDKEDMDFISKLPV